MKLNLSNLSNIRIGYISILDPMDKRSWSGTHFHILHALIKYFPNTVALGPVELPIIAKIVLKIHDTILCRLFPNYKPGYAYFRMKLYASYFKNKIGKDKYDVIFCAAASTALALLKTNLPVIYLSDATFSGLKNYYPNRTCLPKLSEIEGDYAEKSSILRANLIFYSSDWVKNQAINDYGAMNDNIKVFPFGANILNDPTDAPSIQKQNDDQKCCKLLFLAREWGRKGGDIVVATTSELVARGLNVELIVIGCDVPCEIDCHHIQIYEFLNKNLPEDYQIFDNIMTDCHYLFLPTNADCTPMVFGEANAYGMPVITRDTGGVSSIIENNQNGYVLPFEATSNDYADLIQREFFDSDRYKELSKRSRAYYLENLNWDVWAERARDEILQFLNNVSMENSNRGFKQ